MSESYPYKAPTIIEATTEFARLAGLPEATGVSNEPGKHQELRALRVRLLREEVIEYLDGEDHDDPIEIADGLADIIVIAWGTLLTYFGEEAATAIAREVWTTNLSKVDGTFGETVRRGDGKLLKPPGWKAPDIAGALVQHGII